MRDIDLLALNMCQKVEGTCFFPFVPHPCLSEVLKQTSTLLHLSWACRPSKLKFVALREENGILNKGEVEGSLPLFSKDLTLADLEPTKLR